MASYTGWVVAPVKDGIEGWIAISTVKKTNDLVADLVGEKDIFVHLEDISNMELCVGMEIEFNVMEDPVREDAYRVSYGRETKQSNLARFANGGVTLSIEGLTASRTLIQPSVFVSWCISAAVAANIRDARLSGADAPRILIVDRVIGYPRGERRYIANLDDPMKTIEFNASGKHRIVAIVTWKDDLLARENGRYKTDVLNHEGTILYIQSCGTTFVDAEIPAELFADKPGDWGWVNRWFDEPPFDQCAFRRRRVFAYTLQPVLFVIGYLLWALASIIGWLGSATVAIALLILGVLPYTGSLARPWDVDPRDTLRLAKSGSFFWPLVKGQHIPFAILLHPFFWGAVWLFAKWMWPENAFAKVQNVRDVEWQTYAILVSTSVFLVFVLGQLTQWARTMNTQLEAAKVADEPARLKVAQAASTARAKREAIENETRRKLVEAEVAKLICETTGPREPSIEHLALSFKTIRFHAEALKRKVCRPFAS